MRVSNLMKGDVFMLNDTLFRVLSIVRDGDSANIVTQSATLRLPLWLEVYAN